MALTYLGNKGAPCLLWERIWIFICCISFRFQRIIFFQFINFHKEPKFTTHQLLVIQKITTGYIRIKLLTFCLH